MRSRVFLSSVMDGFEEYRQAAREGIVAAGGEPVLAEDFPSLPISSRTACLDGVASSDIYIAIIGGRGDGLHHLDKWWLKKSMKRHVTANVPFWYSSKMLSGMPMPSVLSEIRAS
jgi:Domain of unknown function (DUF4062)